MPLKQLTRTQRRTLEKAIQIWGFLKIAISLQQFAFLLLGFSRLVIEEDHWLGALWDLDLCVHVACFALSHIYGDHGTWRLRGTVSSDRLAAPSVSEKIVEAVASWTGLVLRIALHPRFDAFYLRAHLWIDDGFRAEVSSKLRHWTLFSVQHPRLVAQRVRRALTVVRWAKWGAPIFATSNKLKGNLTAYLKLRRLAYEHEREKKVLTRLQALLKHKKDERELLEFAVRRLQAKFIRRRAEAKFKRAEATRSPLSPVEQRALEKSKQKRYRIYMAVTRVQLAFRRWKARRQLEARSHGFLLRPDTHFETLWMMLYVAAVVVEVVKAITLGSPKHNAEELLTRLLLPEDCVAEEGRFFHGRKRRFLIIGAKAETKALPGYCTHDSWTATLGIATHCAAFLIESFVFLVATLDVPVRFFTGQLNDETGKLEPTPWWPRWVAPGLAIQLVVNPGWAGLTRVIKGALGFAHESGPCGFTRCLIWLRPLFLWVAPWARATVINFVRHDQKHNKHSIFNAAKLEQEEGAVSGHVNGLSHAVMELRSPTPRAVSSSSSSSSSSSPCSRSSFWAASPSTPSPPPSSSWLRTPRTPRTPTPVPKKGIDEGAVEADSMEAM